MRLTALIILIALLSLHSGAYNVIFTGSERKTINITPERNTGLDDLYVIWNISDVTMIIENVGEDVELFRYSNLGGGYSDPVPYMLTDTGIEVAHPEGDMGYIVTTGGKSGYFWVTDYSKHKFELTGVSDYSPQECDNTKISVAGEGDAIIYYTIDGRPVELNREIEVEYTGLTWVEDDLDYERGIQTKVLSHLTEPIVIYPPLYCSTEITVRGDRFLKEWGLGRTEVSPTIPANGIEVHTTAERTNSPEEDEHGSNILTSDNSSNLGGSAPAVVKFTAYVTEAVIHDEWQISRDSEFAIPDYRFNDREIEYSFEEEGTFYVRYIGSNATGECEVYGDTYTINIGASDLLIPNAFTPNDDGVNDIWKVAYRSLLSFKCWIFDRYGNQIYYFDDPNGGWDGKYNSKTVKPGVYYYVIEATGTDNKKYKKGGDINILNYKKNGNSMSE